MEESIQVGIFIVSIEVSEIAPVTVAAKTLAGDDVEWKGLPERLIEEWRGIPKIDDYKMAKNSFTFWNRRRNQDVSCWINPENPKNRVSRLRKPNEDNNKDGKKTKGDGKEKKSEDKKKKEKHRTAMTKLSSESHITERLILDSGTFAHITPMLIRYKILLMLMYLFISLVIQK